AAVLDGDARRVVVADVLDREAKASLRQVLDGADDLSDEQNASLDGADRARRQLGDAVAGERRVDDEDRECGRYRQGDDEPRRTGSHARIVAPLGEARRCLGTLGARPRACWASPPAAWARGPGCGTRARGRGSPAHPR